MLTDIRGLHHVTALASDAQANNAFFTRVLGLRRVKKTVNFDAPEIYHLYYGDETGQPGTVMTHFPFRHAKRGSRGSGEVATTLFAVPEGALPYWRRRLESFGAEGLAEDSRFGESVLRFAGPDGEGLALVEAPGDDRPGWTGAEVPAEAAIRGFRGAELALSETAGTAELLRFMGYEEAGQDGATTRFRVAGGNPADIVDLTLTDAAPAVQGAGSVHHLAFSVPDRTRQAAVRQALSETGCQVTPQIDRDYFWAIYFRSPGGVLFEIATDEPGFARDEDPAHLGEALKLPAQHAHLRPVLESRYLQPIHD
ncbi:VOC family protein [Roseivivax sp. CAU 1761]